MRRDIRTFISLRTVEYLKYVVPIIWQVKNWAVLLTDYIGITNRSRTYIFRNGLRIKTGDGISSGTLVVIFIKKDYGAVPPAGSTVIDIGANIGVYALYACQRKNTRVYAYEPMPENFRVLKKNIEINNLQERIFPFELAVSGGRQTQKLYLGLSPLHSFLPIGESPFHAKFKNSEFQESIEVQCLSLRDVFNENRIERCDMLKLDCEGAEYDILYNLPEEYFSRIQNIRMEYHNHLNNPNNTGESLLKFLQRQGFRIQKVKKGSQFQGDIWLERL